MLSYDNSESLFNAGKTISYGILLLNFGIIAFLISQLVLWGANYYLILRFFLLFSFIQILDIALTINYSDKMPKEETRKITFVALAVIVILFIGNEYQYSVLQTQGYFFAILYAEDITSQQYFIGLNLIMVNILVLVIGAGLVFLYRKKIISKTFLIIAISLFVFFYIAEIIFCSMRGWGNLFAVIQGATPEEPELSIAFDFSASSNVLSAMFGSIMSHPAVAITLVIMMFGAIPRNFPSQSRVFQFVGNLVISWIPIIIWMLFFTGVIPIPGAIAVIFAGFEWFGFLFYVLSVGMVYVIAIAVIMMFTSFTSMFV
jgi:hypothetical protein